jgi:hypothetical protein
VFLILRQPRLCLAGVQCRESRVIPNPTGTYIQTCSLSRRLLEHARDDNAQSHHLQPSWTSRRVVRCQRWEGGDADFCFLVCWTSALPRTRQTQTWGRRICKPPCVFRVVRRNSEYPIGSAAGNRWQGGQIRWLGGLIKSWPNRDGCVCHCAGWTEHGAHAYSRYVHVYGREVHGCPHKHGRRICTCICTYLDAKLRVCGAELKLQLGH